MIREVATRILGFLSVAILAAFLAGCGNDDKYVVKTPIPPAPQQGQGTGH
jgi:hypothetical protein